MRFVSGVLRAPAWLVAGLGALALPAGAMAAPPAMRLATGSVPMTMTASQVLANGQVTTSWAGSGRTVQATGAPGTIVSMVGNTLTLTPPQAGAATTGSAAAVAAANPGNHTWFNAQSGNYCNSGDCVYGSGEQYALQEDPGQWFMFEETKGTVESPGACWGQV